MSDRNTLLAELRDLYVPSTSSLPAVGWWVLLLLIVAVVLLIRSFKRHTRHPRWVKDARSEIAQMRNDLEQGKTEGIVPQCSSLARRLALLMDKNSTHASVIGVEWLSLLDGIVERPLFTEGPGFLLLDAPYEPPTDVEPDTLVSLVDSIERLCTEVQRKWSGVGS